jgi:hypothetical protein
MAMISMCGVRTMTVSWGVNVWLKGSDRDGPADHQYRVVNRELNLSVGQAEKEAIFALIEKREERLPLMVASPINV